MLFTLLAIFLLGNPIIRLAGGSIDIVYVTDKGTQKINKPPAFLGGSSVTAWPSESDEVYPA
jgi:hypothetical protein